MQAVLFIICEKTFYGHHESILKEQLQNVQYFFSKFLAASAKAFSNTSFIPREIKGDYYSTHGFVWLAVTLVQAVSPEPSKKGSGVMATVTSKSTCLGGPKLPLFRSSHFSL